MLHRVLKDCNISFQSNENLHFYDSHQLGKSHKLPFLVSQSHASKPLELVHTNLCGPSPIVSTGRHRYYISFLDDFRYTWVYPLKTKDKALYAFTHFKKMVENQFDKKIKILQSDWGGEIRSFKPLLDSNGIIFRHPCSHTSPQNGRIEREHRHIVETTLLAQPCLGFIGGKHFQLLFF